jgi:hypothetical protein
MKNVLQVCFHAKEIPTPKFPFLDQRVICTHKVSTHLYAVVFMACPWRGCHKGEVRFKRTTAQVLQAAIRVSSCLCQPRVEKTCCRAIYAVLGPGLYAAQKSVLQFFRGLEISGPVVLL